MDDGVSYARLEPESAERFVSLRRALGVTSFGINQMCLQPGQRGRIHRHEHQEEVYLVLEGRLTLEIEGDPTDLDVGQLARVGPEVRRRLSNTTRAPCTVLALGGSGEHQGRDGIAYRAWDDPSPAPPQEIPLPDDLPEGDLRDP